MSKPNDAKKRDPYEILGVTPDDDDETIKRAFRKKSLSCHPDRFQGDEEKAAQFRVLVEAHEQIDTTDKRRKLRRGTGVTVSKGVDGAVGAYFAGIFRVDEQTEGGK